MARRFEPGELEGLFRDAAHRALDDIANDLERRCQEAAPIKNPRLSHGSGALPGNLRNSIKRGEITPREDAEGIEVTVSTGPEANDYAVPMHEGRWESTGVTFKHQEPYKYMERPLEEGIPDYELGFAVEMEQEFPG